MVFEKHTQSNYPPCRLVETWLGLTKESSADLSDARLRSKKLLMAIFGNIDNAKRYIEYCKEQHENSPNAA